LNALRVAESRGDANAEDCDGRELGIDWGRMEAMMNLLVEEGLKPWARATEIPRPYYR